MPRIRTARCCCEKRPRRNRLKNIVFCVVTMSLHLNVAIQSAKSGEIEWAHNKKKPLERASFRRGSCKSFVLCCTSFMTRIERPVKAADHFCGRVSFVLNTFRRAERR